MSAVIYDAGVLVAADRNDRRAWADHEARLEFGILPLVPSTVVAQVSRSPRQAQLRRFLAGCKIAALDEAAAHHAGRLLGKSNSTDVVDAVVVALAVSEHAVVLTSDPDDLTRLVAVSGHDISVVAV